MELRDAERADAERIRELVQSAMTAAYALSPQQLDTIIEERFAAESLEQAFEDDDAIVLVAENGAGDEVSDAAEGEVIVGFVEGRIEDGRGDLRWLFVDPEHRGMGVGTRLFDVGSDTLRENGAESVTASVLEANTEGGTFFERQGLERTDERRSEIGNESFVEYVYAEPSDAESSETAHETSADESKRAGEVDETETEDVRGVDLPGTETAEDATFATTEDGIDVYLDREAVESGTEGPFVVTYTDEELTDRYGYYCGSCGSLDTVVDETERIECADCGNTHAERSAEAYDDSYL